MSWLSVKAAEQISSERAEEMNIALVQSHIIWEDRDSNIAAFEKTVSENAGVDLFLLPEMSFTGFSMNTAKTADRDRETLREMKRIAVRYDTAVGFGWVRPAGEKCENVYTVVDKNGADVYNYAKIHPFSYSGEDRFFSGGTDVSGFELGGIPFSIFICYDLRFPELFRCICDDVHAVIIPANWPAKRSEHWKALLRARAIENQVYIFAVNCAGEINGLQYSGDSCVISPNGDVQEILSDREGIIKYEFTDDVQRYRRSFPVLKDRKPNSFYSRFSLEE